jgi:hypothetical protein
MIISRFTTSLIVIGLLASCSGLEMIPVPVPTPLPTGAPLPTPTIVWFPPSATPSPQAFATYTPIPEMRPGVGDTVVTDDFSEPDLWDIAASDQGSAAINAGRLTLAVQPGVYLISMRHELALGDFYAEVTANPGLCRDDDSYGLLVRGNAVAYYRFSLSCNGTASVERVSVASRQVLQSAVISEDVPRGAPARVRIGMWVVGNEMRLFLNGFYQFSIFDGSYPVGTIGVFAQSKGETAVVVNYSDLVIQDVNYSVATRTPNP